MSWSSSAAERWFCLMAAAGAAFKSVFRLIDGEVEWAFMWMLAALVLTAHARLAGLEAKRR